MYRGPLRIYIIAHFFAFVGIVLKTLLKFQNSRLSYKILNEVFTLSQVSAAFSAKTPAISPL